jgi:hypothetical protein
MFKKLALWYLLRRATSRKDFYSKEIARMTLDEVNDPDNRWMFEKLTEYRANNAHAIRSLNAIKQMEGT